MTMTSTALWNLLNEYRGQGIPEPLRFAQLAKQEGLSPTVWEFIECLRSLDPYSVELTTPRYVLEFVTKLLQAEGVRSVLHPWSGHPWDAIGLATLLGPSATYELCCMHHDAPALLSAFDQVNIRCTLGRYPANRAWNTSEVRDAVVSFGPIGVGKEKATIAGVTVSGDPGLLAMMDAAQGLSANGLVVWLVSEAFAVSSSNNGVKAKLKELGLFLNGYIQLPANAFAPLTTASFALAVLHRKDLGGVYVAELPSAADAMVGFLDRFRKRKTGQLLTHGLVIDRSDFHGAGSIKRAERFRALVRSKDTLVPFEQAVPQLHRSKKNVVDFEHLPEHPDAVYLPLMGRTKATTAQDQLPPALKSYAQLIVDRTVVDPDYLANWLNTDAGLAFRDLASTGTTMPAISLEGLKAMTLPLPSLTTQQSFSKAQRSIAQLRTELNEAEQALWSGRKTLEEVVSTLPATDHAKRFADWVETLPFPLASILRQYYASDLTSKDRYFRLLHFFEALAEFVATIHLSAYTPDAMLWPAMQDKLKRSMDGATLDFRKASFGLWCTVLKALGKETRSALNGSEEELNAVLARYQVANKEVLERLVDKSLSTVLDATNNMRNRQAHGGPISEHEAQERHDELRRQLDTLRDRWSATFYQLRLVQVGQAEILSTGTLRYTMSFLTGSNPKFAHDKIELSQSAITGRLYMHQLGHDKALEIAPLIQMRQKEQAACYFYNRMEGGVPHLVSYHFEHRSDEVDESGSAVAFLLKLNASQ